MNNEYKVRWWGYLHIRGMLQVKRYFDSGDIEGAMQSDFVDEVTGPFEALDREDAMKILRSRLKDEA